MRAGGPGDSGIRDEARNQELGRDPSESIAKAVSREVNRPDSTRTPRVKASGPAAIAYNVAEEDGAFFKGRNGGNRYQNQLDPSIQSDPFSVEEDKIIAETQVLAISCDCDEPSGPNKHSVFELQKAIGNRWCEIARSLPGR